MYSEEADSIIVPAKQTIKDEPAELLKKPTEPPVLDPKSIKVPKYRLGPKKHRYGR